MMVSRKANGQEVNEVTLDGDSDRGGASGIVPQGYDGVPSSVTMPRRAKAPAPEPTGHLVRTVAWSGLRAGDPVEIDGTRLRSARWAFIAHVRNAHTGDEWIEVVGGRPGDHKLRSFRPEQVFPPRSGRGGAARPSLADAPQLPFG
jgi:hypothetical protein